MGADKGGSKSGIFHMFDWKKKSRKKLFSNSPEGAKLEKKIEESLPSARLRLDDEEGDHAAPSIKCSDYSCTSSVTDDDGIGTKAPGVVARLMGLDSMPTSAIAEPYCTPYCDARSFRDNQRNVEYDIRHAPQRSEGLMKRPAELRSQKMPSSPIERFQTEVLPPRSAKSLAIPHHRLLSPIKNPGFTSARNADQIMEAAAKIIETRTEVSSRDKLCSFGPSRVPIRVSEPKDSALLSQRLSQMMQLTRVPPETTNIRYSRGQQQLNSRWNHAEDIVIPTLDAYEINPGNLKGHGKSLSLALQAKVNVQKREGLSLSGSSGQKEHAQFRSSQPFRSQTNPQRIKQQKKPTAVSTPGVLRQNNQKQNCVSSRGKSAVSKSLSSQHGRKVQPGDVSLGRSRTAGKIAKGNPRRYIGESSNDFEHDGVSSNNKDFPQKKRMIERNFVGGSSGFEVEGSLTMPETLVKPTVLVDEQTRWIKDNDDTADVVSFTFTSPLLKPTGSSQFSEKWDSRHLCDLDGSASPYDCKTGNVQSIKSSNHANGDDLSLLLEQKLKELTSRIEPPMNFIVADRFPPLNSTAKEIQSSCYRWDAQCEDSSCSFSGTSSFGCQSSCLSSTNGQVFRNRNSQVLEEGEQSVRSDVLKERQEHEDLSPLSVLEPIFSSESCWSSETSGCSSDGIKNDSSSIQDASCIGNCSSSSSYPESGLKILDTSSSSTLESSDLSEPDSSHDKMMPPELSCIRTMISNFSTDSLCMVSPDLGSPSFDALACRKSERLKVSRELSEATIWKENKRLLHDCVSESLNSKRSIYFQAGFTEWAKGMNVLSSGLATEIYKDIEGWRKMEDKNVDELVDKDMSTLLGSWVDYRIEVHEIAVALETEILDSLLGEVLSDIFVT